MLAVRGPLVHMLAGEAAWGGSSSAARDNATTPRPPDARSGLKEGSIVPAAWGRGWTVWSWCGRRSDEARTAEARALESRYYLDWPEVLRPDEFAERLRDHDAYR